MGSARDEYSLSRQHAIYLFILGVESLSYLSSSEPSTEPQMASTPGADGGLEDSDPDGFLRWQRWASAHGFEAAAPTGVPDTLGIRIITDAPQVWVPIVEDEQRTVPPLQAGVGRRLIWEDPELGARVWGTRQNKLST